MDDIEAYKLFERLGFPRPSATQIVECIRKLCVVTGFIGGVGLAMSATKQTVTGLPAPSARLRMITALAGFGVMVITLGGACNVIKAPLLDLLNDYETADQALGSLDSSQKAKLILDAKKMLQFYERIDELFNQTSDDKFTQRA